MAAKDKLAQKREQLKKLEERIAKLQEQASRLKKEVKELENFEIIAVVDGLKLPVDQVKSLLLELAAKVGNGEQKQKDEPPATVDTE